MVDMEVIENSEPDQQNPKRKLEKTILDNFSKLTNPHETVRIKSAANLLRYLAENSKNEKELNELKYALKRLVRGLGAPTPAARAGYYSALVGLLNVNQNVSVKDVLDLVKSELHKSGKNSDGENADICSGQILTCGAIIRANLWQKCDAECQKQLLEILLTASKERTYLGLVGFSFIKQLLEQLPEKEVESIVLPQIRAEIAKPWADQSLDSLYLLINLKKVCPNICNKKFLRKSLETTEIICTESLEKLCNILMTIPRITSIKHPLYDSIVTEITPKILPNFFYELDKHLKTPNRNRLLVFLKILTNTYLHIANNTDEYLVQIPKILTRNFITQLLGYFRTFKGKQRDKEYQEAVHKFFEVLLATLKLEIVDSNIKISVLKKLLFDPGTFVFEKVTKSKIAQQITQSLDPEGVKNLASVYRGVADGTEKFNSENDSENWLNNDRLYSAHLLIKLLNLPGMKLENEWKVEQLSFLMGISLLREMSGLNVGRELAESLKTAFFGALDLKLSKLEELHTILSHLVQNLDTKLTPENLQMILRNPITSETYDLWKKTLHTVNKIDKKKKKSGISSVFLTLFLHMGLQLFNDVKLATDSLQELFSCYERVRKDKKSKHALDDTTILQDSTMVEAESDPLWIEVVTDLFLNLLSHNSHLLRNIIKCVFPHLCQYMNSTTIHQVLTVFDPKHEENPLSKNDEDRSESENDNSDSESEPEKDAESENDSEGGDDSEDEEDLNKDSDDNEAGTDKLRMALHEALSNGTSHSDDESIDLDEISDTEGEKLDKALADAFRQFRPNHGRRKKQTKDQETLTHFRVRALDLIEVYLDSNPSMHLTLEIMLPLLQSVEFSIRDEHQRPLNNRLRSILKKLLGLRKFSDTEGVDDKILVELLKSLLDKGSKNVLIVQDMGEQISDCCIFVVKCSEMLRSMENTPKKVRKHLKSGILEVLSGELYQFFTKRDCLTPYVLFKHVLQLSWEGNIGLATILLDFMFNQEIRQFKKNQVAELLKIFYTNQRFLSQNLERVQNKMLEAHGEFSSKVIGFFKGLCDEPDRKNIKERFICHFFNLLTALKQSPLKTDNISWSDIAEDVREYRSYKTFSKDAKIAYNKLCRACGVSNIVKMKSQVTKLATLIENEDTENEEKTSDKEKKHKKRNKEQLKMKKEAKKLRLESLSKGLGKVEFDSEEVEVGVLPDDETEDLDDEEDGERKKKKGRAEVNESLGEDGRKDKGKGNKKRRISVVQEGKITQNGIGTSINGTEGGNDNEQYQNGNKKHKKKQQKENSLSEDSNQDDSRKEISKTKRFSEGESLVKKKRKISA